MPKLLYLDEHTNTKQELQVDVITADVANEYIDKLTDGEYLLIEVSGGAYIQTWRLGSLYCLEYHAEGLHFVTRLELVTKAKAQESFAIFLIDGPLAARFQGLQTWVENGLYSDRRNDPLGPHATTTTNPAAPQPANRTNAIPSHANPSRVIEVKVPQLPESD